MAQTENQDLLRLPITTTSRVSPASCLCLNKFTDIHSQSQISGKRSVKCELNFKKTNFNDTCVCIRTMTQTRQQDPYMSSLKIIYLELTFTIM